ncbi:Nramp family divalent metal transporter [Pseudoalteromonas sp. SWXJZ94C]|uniref:Nramp family divalent metal transporter n=1 Tax=Pseudoalteromonas sp. SWXJZ94C TaxID=2792065 RepID=UPI0018CC9F7D|nr:Nramp family divalent metal transporter [Pseudoalteromonas sp. SWXJZ94C]MBH0057679.1 Nramp family divalent metal transporter [Pseudoalteromonas sp. SWXJZ94C]
MKIKLLPTVGSKHRNKYGLSKVFKYIGPGLLITVGFIDPGNWASNIAAGSMFGYTLLWMVTLSTLMLIVLQHNVAHLGIVTGDCLAESAMKNLNIHVARSVLFTSIIAVISTALAEILGGAIALHLLFDIPILIGSVIILVIVIVLLFTNTYSKLEKLIIGFVSIIGFSFLYEMSIVSIDWSKALTSWVTVSIPDGSIMIVMAVLGAVVMPHNLFLHSEIIQSRKWNNENEAVIKKQLRYEFTDTLVSMIIGWAINSAMIILAAAAFFDKKIIVTELEQAQHLLTPMLGSKAALVFGIALLFAGISSTITAGMAGGSVYAGIFKEPYNIKNNHTKVGVAGILIISTLLIFWISDPFKGADSHLKCITFRRL